MASRNNKTSIHYQRVLRIGSLFQDDFSADWISDLLGISPDLVLETLYWGVNEGILDRKGSDFFSFNDLKSRDGYQKRLPENEMTQWHKAIANILSRDLPEGDEKLRIVANHLLKIDGTLDNCRMLMAAGESFLRIFNMEKARRCFRKVISILSDCSSREEDYLFVNAAIKFSKSSTAGSKTSEVLQILENAMQRAQRLGDEYYTAYLEMHLAKTKWLRSRYSSAFKHFNNGLAIAETLDDPKLLRSATNFRIVSMFWNGRFKEAIDTYEALVPEIERLPRGGFPTLAGLTVGRCYVHIGQVSHGLGMLDTIYALCKEKGDKYLAAHAQFTIGATMMDIRHLDKAIHLFKSSIQSAQKEHNEWVLILGNLMLAYTYFLAGQKDEATKAITNFCLYRRRYQVLVQPYPYILELCLAIRQGHLPPVPDLVLEDEMNRMIKGNNVFVKGAAYRFRAILKRMASQSSEDVNNDLNKSQTLLNQSGHCIGLAKTNIEIARQYLLDGDRSKAANIISRTAELTKNFSPTIIPEDLLSLVESPRNNKMLHEILKLGQDLGTLHDTQSLVQRIISTANGITGAERGAIFRLSKNARDQHPELIASRNLMPDHIDHPAFKRSRQIIAQVAKTGEGLIQEMGKSTNRISGSDKSISSSICVPMILRNEVVGVLYLDNRLLKSSFRREDIEMLAFFAGQAALALDNTNAYKKIHDLNLKLKKEKEYYQKETCQELNFNEIVGRSDAFKGVLRQTHLVASTETTVLIVGETGVGKELIARAVHQNSTRNDKPFIKVNTSALDKNLIASELFGHEKGAFTGASHRKVGRFELAHEGTLFLDEIGEISLEIQVILLRVLQTKKFERVGGGKSIRSDFRLIAATNRNLLQRVNAGHFRSDLYYRINVFPIMVPPLRSRLADIKPLANHFLNIQSVKMDKVFHPISSKELSKLMNYDWPGNVRELQNIIERGAILNPGPDFLIPELTNTTQSDNPVPSTVTGGPIVTLEENESRHIRIALKKCNWKVRGTGGAAELLDINPSTLYFRMKKLGIKRKNS